MKIVKDINERIEEVLQEKYGKTYNRFILIPFDHETSKMAVFGTAKKIEAIGMLEIAKTFCIQSMHGVSRED